MAGKVAIKVKATKFFLFGTDGTNLGKLHVVDAEHEDALDGTDQLNITVLPPDDLEKYQTIVFRDEGGEAHEFMVDNPKKSHTGGTPTIEDTAINSIIELNGEFIDDIRPSGSVAHCLEKVLEGTRWSVGEVDDYGERQFSFYHTNAREALSKIVEGLTDAGESAEMYTTVHADENGIVARKVNIVRQRGAHDPTLRFTYGKNITGIERTVAQDDVFTAVYGYGKGEETETGGYGRRIKFGEINGGKDYVENVEATQRWGIPDGKGGRRPRFTTYTDENCTDKQFLLEQTSRYLANVSQPKLTYDVDVALFPEFTTAHVGDVVQVVDKSFEPELRLEGRVARLTRNKMGRVSGTIRIGNDYQLAIAQAEQQDATNDLVDELMDRAADWDDAANISPDYVNDMVQALTDAGAIGQGGGGGGQGGEGSGWTENDLIALGMRWNTPRLLHVSEHDLRTSDNIRPGKGWGWVSNSDFSDGGWDPTLYQDGTVSHPTKLIDAMDIGLFDYTSRGLPEDHPEYGPFFEYEKNKYLSGGSYTYYDLDSFEFITICYCDKYGRYGSVTVPAHKSYENIYADDDLKWAGQSDVMPYVWFGYDGICVPLTITGLHKVGCSDPTVPKTLSMTIQFRARLFKNAEGKGIKKYRIAVINVASDAVRKSSSGATLEYCLPIKICKIYGQPWATYPYSGETEGEFGKAHNGAAAQYTSYGENDWLYTSADGLTDIGDCKDYTKYIGTNLKDGDKVYVEDDENGTSGSGSGDNESDPDGGGGGFSGGGGGGQGDDGGGGAL